MKDLAIAMRIGSPSSKVSLVRTTFESINNNIGFCDWCVFISLGINIKKETESFVYEYSNTYPNNFRVFQKKEVTWAQFINTAISLASEYKYFIKSHDDIELQTPNFYEKVTNTLKNINKPIGWISFTDTGWLRGDFSPPVRTGAHVDCLEEGSWSSKRVFQFHTFPDNWTKAIWYRHYWHKMYIYFNKYFGTSIPPYPKPIKKINKYRPDLPSGPVRCHTPFNHFVMISTDSLAKIGKCEDWGTKNALAVDEDWGLRALKLNLPNIWIPSIKYFHYRGVIYEGGATRSWSQIMEDQKRVEKLFKQKWGFGSDPDKNEIDFIRRRYENTLIPWSTYRRSYEWDYEI